MAVDIQLAMWALGVILAFGIGYGDIRARLGRVENQLGKNGSDGVFARRNEVEILNQNVRENLHQSQSRMDRIQAQIMAVQEQQTLILARLTNNHTKEGP